MALGDSFDVDAADTEAALMAATYHALRKHGYADLTIERIGAEFEKSNSLLYHHYDGKDDLLVSFLDFLLERFETEVPCEDVQDHWAELQCILDHVLAPTVEDSQRGFISAMVELRAQAAHDSAYAAAFTRHDAVFHDRLATVIREGVTADRFAPVDPAALAALVQTTFNGAMLQRVTTDAADGGVAVEAVRQELEAVLEARLLSEAARRSDGP